ncbi:MAG: uncharacterized protein QOK44_2421 [Betaproteobacteria bacterium]|nr:uncharacterized protein [Betaproteobacteria bacterium]
MASITAEPDLCWAPRDLEAQLLAGLLRLSRVSVLYGEAGAGKTTLLFTGVVPLLHRRDEDWHLASNGHVSGAARFPERRRRNLDSPAAELVIFFRRWNDRPLTALRAQIRAALPVEPDKTHATRPLADDLNAWSKEFGVRFLIILDEFEQYLTAPPGHESIEEFADEFSDAVNKSQLPANFLISMRDEAQPLLERFRTRIPGLDNSSFRLPATGRPSSVRTQTTSALLHTSAAAAVPPLMGSGLEAISSEHLASTAAQSITPTAPLATSQESVTHCADAGLVAGLDASAPPVLGRLQGTPAHAAPPPALSSVTNYESYVVRFDEPRPVAVTEIPKFEHADSAIADITVDKPLPEPVNASPGANSLVLARKPRLKWLVLPLVCAPLLLILWTTIMNRLEGDRAEITPQIATDEPANASLATATARGPRIALAMDADNTTDMHIARDLGRVIAPDAGLELVLQPAALLFSNDSLPRLALMRYEFLQVLRTIKDPAAAAMDSLRVIMPLYTEEIYFIARGDSPLTFIHQIEGARINVGLERSSRRLTVARLYQAMFGVAVPMSNASFLSDEEALKQLVKERTVDVVVVIAAQPAKSLANLAAQISGSIKLLKLDPNHPASRRAIDVYLPTTIRAANYDAWLREDTPTLATMAFLVSTGEANPEAAERLQMFAHSLCRTLPRLRRDGHPKWREVQPGLEVDAGWPYSSFAKTAFQSCQKAQNPAAASVVRR